MQLRCIFDDKKYTAKPQGNEVGGIINRMTIDKADNYSIDDIKSKILQGYTVRPSFCGGKEESWQSQQIFMIDIDNEANLTDEIVLNDYVKLVEGKKTKVRFLVGSDQHRTYEDIINHCREINLLPSFVYTSFNHKPEQHKMRLVFILDKAITDINIAKKIQLYLMDSIGEVDEQCKNLNRIYYAGKSIVFENENILDSDNIAELSKDIIIDTPPKPSNIKCSEKCPPNNNRIYNNSYIIRGTKTPTPEIQAKEDYYNIKAISQRNVKYLKEKLNHPHMIFNNNQEFCDYIFKEIDLGELLEFSYPKSIKCLFHEDHNPSASIFQNEQGYWIYKCWGCGVSYNLLGVIEMLGKFRSRPRAYRFIRSIFNLEVKETEWQQEQKEILLENIKVLNNGELEQNCPQTYKNIKSNIKYLNQLLVIAMDNVTNEKMVDDNENVLFFASNKYVAARLGMNEESSKEVSKKATLMAYHKLLNKVDDKNANINLVKRSRAISINSTEKNKKYRHVNYYSIPSYNNMLFGEIEEQGLAWKENNYTIKGLSREMFFRKEGKDVADWLYPQYKEVYDKKQEMIIDRRTSYRSNQRTNRIVELIFSGLAIKDYVTEREIIDLLLIDKDIRITKSEAERQLKKSLPEILDNYDLKRIRTNKQIKDHYGISGNGYPFIICT